MPFAVDWIVTWQAATAVATALLFIATALLAIMAFHTVLWAKRTFGQAEEIERRRRTPLLALSLSVPSNLPGYNFAQNEGQKEQYLKWGSIAVERATVGYATVSVVACFAQNIGDGPALRIRVPYELQVFDVIEGGLATSDDPVAGEFEITNLQEKSWGVARTYLNATYYPKYRITLQLKDATVIGVDGDPLDHAVSETTSQPVLEINNKTAWDLVKQYRQQYPQLFQQQGGAASAGQADDDMGRLPA
jgi:hypothetical protein